VDKTGTMQNIRNEAPQEKHSEKKKESF
jgi:hypothetical protein